MKLALERLEAEHLKKYPDPAATELVRALADRYGVKPEQVFVGVGSDDVLAMSFLTFFNSEKPVLFPDITYSFYDVWAELFRIPYVQIPLNERFEICPEDYFAANRPNGGVIFPNPNAPTGLELDPDAVGTDRPGESGRCGNCGRGLRGFRSEVCLAVGGTI